MSNCIICNKFINSGFSAVLDEDHKAHLICWCSLLPNISNVTEKERKDKKDKLEELIKYLLIK